MLRKPLHNIWSRNIFPVSMEDCGLYLPMWQEDMQSSPLLSYDPYHHSCAVTTAVWGVDGRVFTLDDDIDLVNVLSTLSTSTKGTWIAWVRPDDATPAGAGAFITFGDTDVNEFIEIQIVVTTGLLQATCYQAGGIEWNVHTDASPFSDATWACIGLVQDGTSPVLYVNGQVPDQTHDYPNDKGKWFSVLAGLDNGFIGARQIGGGAQGNFLNGREGEVLLSTSAFSADEMLNFVEVTKWRYI